MEEERHRNSIYILYNIVKASIKAIRKSKFTAKTSSMSHRINFISRHVSVLFDMFFITESKQSFLSV